MSCECNPPKKKKKKQDATCPEWMMTMGDAMSLLLCFFVLLLTFSTMQEAKLMDVIGVLQGANAPADFESQKAPSEFKEEEDSIEDEGDFGGIGTHEEKLINEENLSPIVLDTAEIQNRFNEIKRKLSQLGFKNMINIETLNEGISIKINAALLFHKDTAEFTEKVNTLVQGYANLAGNVGNEIRVVAHFSARNSKKNKRFTSEWGLSIKRTIALGDLLVNQFKLSQSRIAMGTQLIASGQTDFIEFMLVEKIGVKEMSIKELLSLDLSK